MIHDSCTLIVEAAPISIVHGFLVTINTWYLFLEASKNWEADKLFLDAAIISEATKNREADLYNIRDTSV